MFLLLLASSLAGALVILPGYILQGDFRGRDALILLLPAFGIGVWSLMIELHVGRQSLGNVIEVPLILVLAVAIAYLKLVVLDQRLALPSAFVLLLFSTVALRLLMPEISE